MTTGTHVTRFSSYLDMTAEEISPYAVGNQVTTPDSVSARSTRE